ncbi:MAG: hypothetical protein K2K25_11985 [Muribaculaceae bacterium]|nr:hypothetical protein [Muribaculaceae bacterium]
MNEVNHTLLKYINSWRHTRGYGVHSPLAFKIVKECVRPDSRYGFYSDAFLDFEYHEDRKSLKNARLAIRLINLLRPSRIWYPNGDKRLCTALKMSFPSIHLSTQKECPKNVNFIISSGCRDIKGMWEKMDGSDECTMLIFSKIKEEEPLGMGKTPSMILYGRNFTIMIRRVGMERICYTL